jgi:hypothetical protein
MAAVVFVRFAELRHRSVSRVLITLLIVVKNTVILNKSLETLPLSTSSIAFLTKLFVPIPRGIENPRLKTFLLFNPRGDRNFPTNLRENFVLFLICFRG